MPLVRDKRAGRWASDTRPGSWRRAAFVWSPSIAAVTDPDCVRASEPDEDSKGSCKANRPILFLSGSSIVFASAAGNCLTRIGAQRRSS